MKPTHPTLTNKAKQIILEKGAKKLGAFKKKGQTYLPFDSIDIVRVSEDRFDISVCHKGTPIFSWKEVPAVFVGETLHINGLSRCAINLELK